METRSATRTVLLLGKSRLVLADTVQALKDLGYAADGTSDFNDVADKFDISALDLVVLGGQVPTERKMELIREIRTINREVIFVQGLAGIPGLLIDQVRGAFAAADHTTGKKVARVDPDGRAIVLTLPEPTAVKVTAFWQTSFVPPDPKSDSLVLLDDMVAAGEVCVPVPDVVPAEAAFVSVAVGDRIDAFNISTEG
jgi:hypothetical protein